MSNQQISQQNQSLSKDDISFVGIESPRTYLETLYRRQREMEVHRPRKLKAGQTLNESDEKWDKEYKLLWHRINYIETVVRTGKDFPDPEGSTQEPPSADPTFKLVQVTQDNSPDVFNEGHFTPLRTQIYQLTEQSDLNFVDLVPATNNDPVLAQTRQMLINGKPEAEAPPPHPTT